MSLRAIGESLQMPVMPSDTGIAPYHTYAEARVVVGFLSNEGFDVKLIMIVGTDLHLMERATGRLTMVKAALSGASSDALWGAFMGPMISFVSTNRSAFLWVLFDIAGGMLAGAFMSELLYTMTGGRRDFTSQSQVAASRYAVLASAGIDQTFRLLQCGPDNQVRPCPACRRPESRGPSECGSRFDERPHLGVRLNDEGKNGGAEASRGSRRAASAQGPAKAAVEPAKDSRKPLD